MAISRFSDSSIQDAFPKYNSLWDGRSAVGSMDAISAITLSSAQSTITFSNIPQTYTHLQVRFIAATSVADQDIWVNFNADTASNYSEHRFYTNGTTITSGGLASQGKIEYFGRSGSGSNVFASNIVDIPDYTNTNKYKTIRSNFGWDNNTTAFVMYSSGSWRNTNAITSMVITPQSGTFSQYSSFALYGIK